VGKERKWNERNVSLKRRATTPKLSLSTSFSDEWVKTWALMWQLRNDLDSNFCYNSKNENYFSIQTCSYYFHTNNWGSNQ
jgi:hypothetical protein